MHWIDWAIMLVPFAVVMALAFHARRYARDVWGYSGTLQNRHGTPSVTSCFPEIRNFFSLALKKYA